MKSTLRTAAVVLVALLFQVPAHAVVDYCLGATALLQSAINAAENDGDASRITLQTSV